MDIFRPLAWHDNHLIERYQVKTGIQKIMMRKELEEVLFDYQNKSDAIFLLDEESFDLIRYAVEGMLYDPLTIEQLNNLVAQKIVAIQKEYNIKGKLLLYDMDHIRVNGEASRYLLGQKGKLERDIFLIFIKPSLALSLPHLWTSKELPRIYPMSYFTVQFITQQLKIPSFVMLTIYEHSTKFIMIKDGFYHTIHTLDRWINDLKQILINHNIVSYLDKDDASIEGNSFAARIMQEGLDFFMNILFNRVIEQNEWVTTFIISYPEFKNTFFYNSLLKHFQDRIWGYLLPSSIHHQLKSYKRKRTKNEIDILSYLNFSEKKELI